VKHDPGCLVRSEADIQTDRDEAERAKDEGWLRELRDEVPREYRPPHQRARLRLVYVRVEDGPEKGLEGYAIRMYLRPM
jgi:hypothetical protein